MLSSILAKSDCAACKFCCSFRRTSLWETPVIPAADIPKLQELFPNAKFRQAGKDSYTFDLNSAYKTSDPAEEAPCPFLDPDRGCALPPDLKPFECKIWPLRAVRLSDSADSEHSLAIALTPTCPAINKVPEEKVRQLAAAGLGKTILDYAEGHPDIIKEASEFLSKIVYK